MAAQENDVAVGNRRRNHRQEVMPDGAVFGIDVCLLNLGIRFKGVVELCLRYRLT